MSEQPHTASSITDQALDELYAERDALLAALGATAADAARHRWCSMRENQLVQRAEQAEELLGVAEQTSNVSEEERARASARVQQAEAAIERVRILVAPWSRHGGASLPPTLVARLVREALDDHQE